MSDAAASTSGPVGPDPIDLDPEDAFGHDVLPDAPVDRSPWSDGDDDDVDV